MNVSRPRRLRNTRAIRRALSETTLEPRHLVAPLFVKEGLEGPMPIASMPGQVQHDLASVVKEARELANEGVSGILLFGVPAAKDEIGTEADSSSGISQMALTVLRDELGDDMIIVSDLCLCEYTSHGHCAVMTEQTVDEHATLERYAQVALAQASAGAHFVAPSGMMDGQVAAIRSALDSQGYDKVGMVAYAAKFASSLYAPFRDAAEGTPSFGDRRSHQLDVANAREAMREIALDLEEGADIVMVKPAGGYLDIVAESKLRYEAPLAAYQVSGEYSMLHAAAAFRWIDYQAAVTESLLSIKRAGADLIVTYFAKEAARWLQ